jgi:hypothetical protein
VCVVSFLSGWLWLEMVSIRIIIVTLLLGLRPQETKPIYHTQTNRCSDHESETEQKSSPHFDLLWHQIKVPVCYSLLLYPIYTVVFHAGSDYR